MKPCAHKGLLRAQHTRAGSSWIQCSLTRFGQFWQHCCLACPQQEPIPTELTESRRLLPGRQVCP